MMNRLASRFKKMTKGARPKSDDVRFHSWMYKDENIFCNSEYRLNVSPVSSSSFKKTVSNRRTVNELVNEEEQKSRKERVVSGSTEEVKKIVFENKSEDCLKSNSSVDYSRMRSNRVDSGEWRKLKTKKMNEIMLRNEKQGKCVDVMKKTNRKKSKQDSEVNAYTPRTISRARVECKIKALEDMKRARMKMNKEREVKDAFRTYLDSFAILKCSFDPRQDFRDSMMEMILENGIKQREELEELLACYLTLNCDEYHNLIVKVFKEVWLELKKANFDPYL